MEVQDERTPPKLTPEDWRLLARVAERDRRFCSRNIDDPTEDARLTKELQALRRLQARGLLTTRPTRDGFRRERPWSYLAPALTGAGRKALAQG